MKEQQFESLLRQALRPEIEPGATVVHTRTFRKGKHMNIKRFVKQACTAAAVIALLITTVYAADELNIKTLISGFSSSTYETVEKAEKYAGFEIDDLEQFSNGYSFVSAQVGETKALDQDDNVRLTYNEIHLTLRRTDGKTLTLSACQQNSDIPTSSLPPQQSMVIGQTTVNYRVDHYKLVPADYAQTEADRAWLQQPGNFMSYGADEVTETDMAFLTWEKDGIHYILLDTDAGEPADSLFSMAQELILSGK